MPCMKTSNPISSVKKLRIGGFIFRVFNSHGNILQGVPQKAKTIEITIVKI